MSLVATVRFVSGPRVNFCFPPSRVRFQGRIVLPDGSSYLDRTTLTKIPNGAVRQVLEISRDDGETWNVGFDASYKRRR